MSFGIWGPLGQPLRARFKALKHRTDQSTEHLTRSHNAVGPKAWRISYEQKPGDILAQRMYRIRMSKYARSELLSKIVSCRQNTPEYVKNMNNTLGMNRYVSKNVFLSEYAQIRLENI